MDSDVPRPLTEDESALLEAFLAHDFPGVEALRAQVKRVSAKRGCTCGCGTIDLLPQGDDLPKSIAREILPVSGHVFDADGEAIGGVMLFLSDGLLSTLEVCWYRAPIPLPHVEDVQWQF
jgi:hypothetical protein